MIRQGTQMLLHTHLEPNRRKQISLGLWTIYVYENKCEYEYACFLLSLFPSSFQFPINLLLQRMILDLDTHIRALKFNVLLQN